MTITEIIYLILFGSLVIYTIVSKLIDRKNYAKMILDLFKLMFDMGICKIEPEQAQDLYFELYNDAFMSKKKPSRKSIEAKVKRYITENTKRGK